MLWEHRAGERAYQPLTTTLAGLVLCGLLVCWEPLRGILTRTVMLNNFFKAVLIALTVLAVTALVLALKAGPSRGPIMEITRILAIAEVLFLAVVWSYAFNSQALAPFPGPNEGHNTITSMAAFAGSTPLMLCPLPSTPCRPVAKEAE